MSVSLLAEFPFEVPEDVLQFFFPLQEPIAIKSSDYRGGVSQHGMQGSLPRSESIIDNPFDCGVNQWEVVGDLVRLLQAYSVDAVQGLEELAAIEAALQVDGIMADRME
jgi:hypothetical protein